MTPNDVVIKKSRLHGRGVFATRDFKKGEVVLRWDVSHRITRSAARKLSKKMKTYLNRDVQGRLILLVSPERYVNHSSNANTKVKKACDVATRTIYKGEEITSNYTLQKDVPENMKFWKL